MTDENPIVNKRQPDNRVSVDCVILGFDGKDLNVLLVRRTGVEAGEYFHDRKLPGSPIYMDEDLDDAAKRVLLELTGLKNISMTQFKAFGSRSRTMNPKDIHWLQSTVEMEIGRIVTIAYIALLKIDSTIIGELDNTQAEWVPVGKEGDLAFDHNQILTEAVSYIRKIAMTTPEYIFDLLPRKFTILQLRKIYETIHQTSIDAGNFYKKLAMMPYVVPLEEKEEGKPHKAARLYKFDKKIYKKWLVK